MTLLCSICNNRMKNKHSLSTHVWRYHPKNSHFDASDSTSLSVKKLQLSENQDITKSDVNFKTDSTKENQLQASKVDVDQKDKYGLQDKENNKSFNYVPTCPSMMKDLKFSDVKVKERSKSKSRKRKQDDMLISNEYTMTDPIPPPRTKFSENSDVLSHLSSIKSDLQNYISKSSRPLNLLTCFGIRQLLFKKICEYREDLLGKFTGEQLLLVDAVLSFKSLEDVCKLLNNNIDILLKIITCAINMDDLN